MVTGKNYLLSTATVTRAISKTQDISCQR